MNDVPLIQRADVNSINTSIIAIKKQLKQIEQMLGGIGGTELPTDILYRKDVADVVQEGNNNPVSSGAVDEAIKSLDVNSVGGSGKYISAIEEVDGKINATASNLVDPLLEKVYPIGAIFMSVNSTSPQTFLGGTWQRLPNGVFLRNGGGNAGTIGQTQAEGLPNITGSVTGTDFAIGGNSGTTNNGALKGSNFNKKTASGTSSYANYMATISFDAHDSNTIYGNSEHVTPYNMAVYMWRRTA